ncbi:TonB-dependent receptor family protein [Bdellovibrio reynosensis]|uniref:TonB-dependent receptor n=1 Tax=Bdellovibrio reynosensis TaxID=2835041 RepID=A0ABY4C7Q4_9BACT|nr:TonB-dependent receptor [Bdellovibrio reynosensis]UOF00945.1 TonB-dependent receptor [Bdellovibrio reynosensis]
MINFVLIVLCVFFGLNSQAEGVSEVSAKMSELGPVKIIGSSEEELLQPNSAHFIDKQKIEQQQQSDVNRVLKQVPGVYVQEEDGFGLRPNIGLRGTHPHRSRKIVILEDGILIGPAPYSAPAAYYTPFMSKVESMEVFKGVASVPYGPNSIGGAINYITRSLPKENRTELDFAGGTYNTQKYRANLGRVWDQGAILFEGAHLQTDGFKKLDNGKNTGFDKNDFLVKGEQRLTSDRKQSIEWKVGYGTELSDESYLGLTQDDFFSSPYRRYAASENDLMDWQHEQYQLTYKSQLQENLGIWATGYHHKFHRNWSRFNNFRDTTVDVNSVLRNPDQGANQLYYDVLSGNADSASVGAGADIVVTNNDRYFYSQGLQLGSFSYYTVNDWTHQLSLGLRLHEDQIRRNHSEDIFSMTSGNMVRTADARRKTAINKDNTQAVSVSATDEMIWQAWKFTVSGRFENVTYASEDDLTAESSNGTENVFVPGAGALYQINDKWSALLGVNRGVTIVGPGQTLSEKPEESMNYETGVRYSNPDQEFFAEGIAFVADYQNIKGTCSFSSGCTGNTLDQEFDGGKAMIRGLETRFAKGFMYKNVYIPVNFNVTVTKAEFAADSYTTNPEWGVGDIHSGDPLPYVPEAQYSLGVGTQYKKYSQEFILSWTGKMYDQSVETNRQEIPAYGVMDWTMKYQYQPQGSVYARIDNILDHEYLVSLRPFGARPGKARSLLVGLKHTF